MKKALFVLFFAAVAFVGCQKPQEAPVAAPEQTPAAAPAAPEATSTAPTTTAAPATK